MQKDSQDWSFLQFCIIFVVARGPVFSSAYLFATHLRKCTSAAIGEPYSLLARSPKTDTGYGPPIHGGGGAPAPISDNSTRPDAVMVCVPSPEDCVAKTKIPLTISLQSGVIFLGPVVAYRTRPFLFCG